MLRLIGSAIAFLTILPGGRQAVDGRDLPRAACFFPLVGWLLAGLLAALSVLLIWLRLPALPIAVLVVSLQVWLTRALHLDGLADLLDGLGVTGGPERRLAVMKDSTIGVFGAAGLVLHLLLKVACLGVLLDEATPMVPVLLAAGPVVGRLAMVALAWRSSYPRPTGTGHAFVGRIDGRDLAVAAVFGLPILAIGLPGLGALVAGLLPAWWLRVKAKARLGGVTGDVLGAACELGEASAWLAGVVCLSVLA